MKITVEDKYYKPCSTCCDVYCLFDSCVEKDKMFLVTDKDLEDRIKRDLK